MHTLTQELLKEFLSYNPETGIFTWLPRDRKWFKNDGAYRSWNTKYPGTKAMCLTPEGYIKISILKKRHQAHRLAWIYVTGEQPPKILDHINRIKSDNSFSNLRPATKAENAQNMEFTNKNNATGFLGVFTQKNTNRYRSRIKVNAEFIHLGYFDTPEEAHNAYISAKKKFHTFSNI